jgi:oxygen-independent coproporphyrinogen-3 oxidase
LSSLRLPPLSLYIHIPWCVRKCPYCDFNSHESSTPIPERAYVEQLLADLTVDKRLSQGRVLTSIFFGGGTPSLFSAESIAAIMHGVAQRIELNKDVEVTLEANPGTAEASKFAGFREAGVNRMSIGVQSFDDDRLQTLGRIHSSDEAIAAIELASGLGLRSFNIDLMHGLPEQGGPDASEDLHTALSKGAPHLSWYQLTIEPNTRFHKQPPILPRESTLAEIQDRGEKLLTRGGYSQYEVSAWARPGHQCRHNLNYWQFGDYLGIGAGAHSKITDMDSRQVIRFAKKRQPADYLQADPGQLRVQQRVLAEHDLISEYMMNTLRLRAGFEPADFENRTGLGLEHLAQPLDSLRERKLLEPGSSIKTTALGWRYLDSVIAEFF